MVTIFIKCHALHSLYIFLSVDNNIGAAMIHLIYTHLQVGTKRYKLTFTSPMLIGLAGIFPICHLDSFIMTTVIIPCQILNIFFSLHMQCIVLFEEHLYRQYIITCVCDLKVNMEVNYMRLQAIK